jgi:hypothetical protein
MQRAGTKKVRRLPALPEVPVVVVQPFRWRQCVHREGERVLLTRHTARSLLETGAVKLLDGAAVDWLYPVRRFRCSVVGAIGEF